MSELKKSAKRGLADLALHGGKRLFHPPISTSNLVRPDPEKFFEYSRRFYQSGSLSNNGPLVLELEDRLAAFHEVRHCVCFANGFWALVLAIRCLCLPEKKEVIMPSLTYRRLADVVNWAGLVPRFCEVEESTLGISAETASPHINDDTALVIGVHPIVNGCDAVGLEKICARSSLPLLFDSVESVYERLGGRKVGGFGHAEVFSMHASKLINGFEGGYVTTQDVSLAQRLKIIRGFAFAGPDRVTELGLNAKLNEMHAAMALAALDDLEQQIKRNEDRYRVYQKELAGLQGIHLREFDEREATSFKNILIELTEAWPLSRDLTIRYLNSEGVLARAYYSPALHQKTSQYKTIHSPLPNTERQASRFLLLPCGHFVDRDDIKLTVELLKFLRLQAPEIQKREKAAGNKG